MVSTVYIRATDKCNLKCYHCYSLQKESSIPAVYMDKVTRIYKSAKIYVFHGGEPSLMPISWYEEAFKVLRKKSLVMQSNLTNTEFVKFLIKHKEKFHNSVGTSLDMARVEYFDTIFSHIYMLKKSGVSVGAIITITDEYDINNYIKIVKQFKKAGGSTFTIQLVSPVNGIKPVNKEKAIELLLYLSSIKGNTLVNKIKQNTPEIFGGNCARRIRVINPDGSIYPCPELAGKKEVSFKIGSVFSGEINQEPIRAFYLRQKENITKCDEFCFRICGSGCFATDYYLKESRTYCDVYKNFIKHVLTE